jgi:hypothetical protein
MAPSITTPSPLAVSVAALSVITLSEPPRIARPVITFAVKVLASIRL